MRSFNPKVDPFLFMAICLLGCWLVGWLFFWFGPWYGCLLGWLVDFFVDGYFLDVLVVWLVLGWSLIGYLVGLDNPCWVFRQLVYIG